MQESEEPSEELTEEQRALIEVMGPPKGDVVIEVESHDRALLNALWDLQGEGVVVQERLQKAGFDPGTVHLILHDLSATFGAKVAEGSVAAGLAFKAANRFIDLANRTFDLVERVQKITRAHAGDPIKDAKTKIRARKEVVPALIAKYKDVADIEIDEAEGDPA